MTTARFGSLLASAAFAAALLVAPAILCGCGPQKPEESSKVSQKPSSDKLRTVNDDILYGRLEEETFSISSVLLPRVELKRSEIKELGFGAATEQDSIRTRRGDMLRGRIEPRKFHFKADVGVSREFRSSDLKRIVIGS